MTSRELVYKALNFQKPKRAPRHLWELPWAEFNYPDDLKKIKEDFPSDILWLTGYSKTLPKTTGDKFEIGEYIDEWGCKFENKQRGIHGETKEYLIKDEEWEDRHLLRTPDELLDLDAYRINQLCQNSDKFIIFGCQNPFERLQYIRGTEQLFVDLMLRPEGMFETIDKIHDFNCKLYRAAVQTEVDAIAFMDDWGS